MSRNIRRLIFFSLLILFFITAPLLLMYTAGYRYNFKKNKFEKTGILILESDPLKADIYLNNELLPEKTKAIIDRLFPENYDVRVEKRNYHPWQKELTVSAGLTTFAQNIILLKNELPTQLIDKNIDSISISPTKVKLIYSLQNSPSKLWLLNLENGSEKIIFDNPANENQKINFKVNWSTSSNKILLTITKQLPNVNNIQNWVIDLENSENKILISSLTKIIFEDIKWEYANDNILYSLANGIIYKINLNKNSVEQFYSYHDLKNFYLYFDLIYFIVSDENNNKSYLKYININEPQEIYNILNLPLSLGYQFLDHPPDKISLLDADNNSFYLIKPGTDLITTKTEIFDNVKQIFWTPDYSKFLYSGDFELWIGYPSEEKSEKILLNRFSQKIGDAAWYPNYEYIIFSLDNSIQAIELDGRNGRNITQLTKLDLITNLTIDSKGEKIYFKGKIGQKQGIYTLQIH